MNTSVNGRRATEKNGKGLIDLSYISTEQFSVSTHLLLLISFYFQRWIPYFPALLLLLHIHCMFIVCWTLKYLRMLAKAQIFEEFQSFWKGYFNTEKPFYCFCIIHNECMVCYKKNCYHLEFYWFWFHSFLYFSVLNCSNF